MFEGNLADFEELVQSVRDHNSREYIGEAAANYRSRCFRSAISATWVAVSYDIISKIRELSLQGDGQARVFIERVDKAISLRIVDPVLSKRQLQAIEGELLKVAHETFEFLTDHELRDMKRLRDDRHLCAHPAFAGDDYLYQPTPELVRMHVVHAISNLLQHPPIQGKSALQRLKNDLLRTSFPTTQTTVSEFLDERYLKHIKLGLVDNLVTVLLKVIVLQSEPSLIGKEEAVIMSLVAVQRRHAAPFAERMRLELPRLCDGCTDDQLIRVMRLFRADRRCWGWLGKASQIRITEIVNGYTYDGTTLDSVCSCLEIDELRPLLSARATSFNYEQKQILYSRNPSSIFIDDATRQYAEANSYRGAEERFETMIRPFISVYRPDNLKAVLDAAMGNGQIYCASKTPVQMTDLFERTIDLLSDTQSNWHAFLTLVLERYDTEGQIYTDLQQHMTLAGIWPIPAPSSATPLSAE